MQIWIDRRVSGEPKPHTGVGVAIFDVEGTVLDADIGFLTVTGYTIEEIRGEHHRMFVPEDERGDAYDAFWRSILGGEVNTARPTRIGKDGRRLRLQASYSPILGFDGSPIGVLKSALDVTAPGAGEGVPLPRLKGPSLRPRPVWPDPVGGGPRVAP